MVVRLDRTPAIITLQPPTTVECPTRALPAPLLAFPPEIGTSSGGVLPGVDVTTAPHRAVPDASWEIVMVPRIEFLLSCGIR